MVKLTRWISTVLLGSAALLAGCSGVRVIESTVQSYSTLTALPSPPTYRLEQLPSQQADAPSFAAIAHLAEQAMARIGLRRDDATGTLVAQVRAHADATTPAGPLWPRYSMHWGFGRGVGTGFGWNSGFMMNEPYRPLYRREVSLLLRNARTHQVVYETSARYEDLWVSDPYLFGVLFDAALTGFPQPPAGPRLVRTTITASP